MVGQHDATIWMPITQIDYFVPGTLLKTSWDFQVSRADLYGRLRPGVSLTAARDASRGLMDELSNQHPQQIQKGVWLQPYSGSAHFRDRESFKGLFVFIPVGRANSSDFTHRVCELEQPVLSRAVGRVRELVSVQRLSQSIELSGSAERSAVPGSSIDRRSRAGLLDV